MASFQGYRRRYNPTGRGRGEYAQPHVPFYGKEKTKGDSDFPELSSDQRFREDHFLNEVVFPHFLDDVMNSPRYQHRWGGKRPAQQVHDDLREGLIGDLRKWLAKREKRKDENPIGTYSAAVLSKAGNDLVRMTYEQFLTAIYEDKLRPPVPRTKGAANV